MIGWCGRGCSKDKSGGLFFLSFPSRRLSDKAAGSIYLGVAVLLGTLLFYYKLVYKEYCKGSITTAENHCGEIERICANCCPIGLVK